MLAFGHASSKWAFGLLIAVLIALLSRFLSLVLRMREQGLAFSLSQSMPKLLFLLAVLGAWTAQLNSFDVLVAANVATLALVLAAYGYNTRSAWMPGLGTPFDWTAASRMIKFGAPLVLGGTASWMVMNQDKLLLRNLSTMQELGIYSVAASLASAVGVATVLFTTVWVPTVYKWHAQGDGWPRVQAAVRHVNAASFFVIAVAGALSPIVKLVLPERYALVSVIIPACMTLPVFYALSEATAVGIGIARSNIYSMLASILGGIAGFFVGMLLVPAFGARGAAISAVIAGAVFVIARTEFAHRIWKPVIRGNCWDHVHTMHGLCNGKRSEHWQVVDYMAINRRRVLLVI
jgi:O-antigen/teichoic acid export membrane protein